MEEIKRLEKNFSIYDDKNMTKIRELVFFEFKKDSK